MNSIEPFNYEDLKKFNYSYLSGFLSEKYDMSKEDSINEANNRAKNSFINEMKKDISGYDDIRVTSSSINLNNTKSNYVLLPVWFLNIRYKDKDYPFAMNGQTGKTVGNIPIDIKKAIFMWIGIFLAVFIILLIINYIKVSFVFEILKVTL